MYCCHCGKEINAGKVESQRLSIASYDDVVDDSTEIQYVCPRCGHLIHQHVTEQELKTLSAASHAEIQRGRYFFASGMSLNLIGAIILVLAIIFLVLAHKPANNFALVTTCPEFFVCVAFFIIAGILIGVGLVLTVIGILKKAKYQQLLKDIQNQVFYQ